MPLFLLGILLDNEAFGHGFRGDRAAEKVPLGAVATHIAEHRELAFVLNAFRYDLETEIMGEIDDAFDYDHVVRIGSDVVDERSVDLQFSNRKTLKVIQARVSRSEIVDGNLETDLRKFFKSGYRFLDVLYEHAFRNLQSDFPGVGSRFL